MHVMSIACLCHTGTDIFHGQWVINALVFIILVRTSFLSRFWCNWEEEESGNACWREEVVWDSWIRSKTEGFSGSRSFRQGVRGVVK